MLKIERQNLIKERLEKAGTVLVSDLVSEIKVDPVTIRRDLNEMEMQGKLQRVHGGAIRISRESKPGQVGTETHRIAEAASRLISDQDVIFIGPGQLSAAMVPFLIERKHLTIITNALNTAWAVQQQKRHVLHVIGGQVEQDDGIYGDVNTLNQIRVDWIFLEAEGLDADRGFTHSHQESAAMTRILMNLGAQTVVLLTPERIGRVGALFIAPANEIDVVITTREAATPPLWDLSEMGIRIILA